SRKGLVRRRCGAGGHPVTTPRLLTMIHQVGIDAMTATTTAAERAEISRRNGSKSRGPRTPDGKDRSKFNALKHGMDAKTPVLPGEDAEAYRARIDAWTADFRPRNEFEQFLIE